MNKCALWRGAFGTFALVVLAGCAPHFKESDSYGSMFRNDEVEQMPQKGDPYTFGGIAEGSGGRMARQSYATDTTSPDFRDATETGKMGEIDKGRPSTIHPNFEDSAKPPQPQVSREPIIVTRGPSQPSGGH